MGSSLKKLELGLWTYGLLSVLDPNSQNLFFFALDPKVKVVFKIW